MWKFKKRKLLIPSPQLSKHALQMEPGGSDVTGISGEAALGLQVQEQSCLTKRGSYLHGSVCIIDPL